MPRLRLPSLSPSRSKAPQPRGLTLVEMLMSFTILSIGALGFVGAFMGVAKSIHVSKGRAVANNLLQEKIESLKNLSYYRLLPTTAPVTSAESGITPFQYDQGFYPPETLAVGDIRYTRRVLVEKVSATGAGDPVSLSWQAPDSGLKRIQAYVLWQDQSQWRVMELQNLVNNPNRQFLNGQVRGTVSVSAGSPLGATVMTAQNASWFDQASAAGAYSFYVSPGTYSLTASLHGYFPQTVSNAAVVSNSSYTWNPTLTQMSAGTVTGTAYLRDHLVLSRVVGDYLNAGFHEEYVELYNPTTWTWTIPGDISIYFQGRSTDPQAEILYSAVNNTVAPGGFYLFANTTTVHGGGSPVDADAVWTSANAGNAGLPLFTLGTPNAVPVFEDGGGNGVGGLKLLSAVRGAQDRFGWKGGGVGSSPAADVYETTPYDHSQTQGLNQDEQFRRFTASSGFSTASGPAYDTQDNDLNWDLNASVTEVPRATAINKTVLTGTPAAGAYVSADDGLSDPAQCATDGTFSLASVATGTWSVALSSSTLYVSTPAAITSNGQVLALGTVAITSATTSGFVTGVVRAAGSNAVLPGITVQGGSGANIGTGSNGRYTLSLTPGLTSLTANPGNLSNGSYVSQSIDNVSVDTGVYTTGMDFLLDTGGEIHGYVAIGGNPLPGISATATDSGSVVAAEAVSDTGGAFSLRNLSTGAYTIDLQLESGEAYTPGATTATITTAGQSVFAGSFTVTSAFGWVTGSLTASGLPVKTGALMIASTATISSTNPPDVDSTLRAGVSKYYAASSLTDGTYELHLPGGNPGTPISYNVYAWYTTWSGTTPTTVKQTGSASVTGGQTTSGVNFSW